MRLAGEAVGEPTRVIEADLLRDGLALEPRVVWTRGLGYDPSSPSRSSRKGPAMSKRDSLAKKSVRTGANNSSGTIVADSRKGVINPGPSKAALSRIEMLEESSHRSEQRLGMTRLI